ncbi:putative Ubiquitin homeostasis protein lub1 [Seiridium cardinale]|uniref:Ubiquitin homeostasis protein lub1 n=1 Tax=Seiridium cardinale TaxID=138064 RepID=A0ABR2XEB5_9PEZI
MGDFKLSAQLVGHDSDIRDLAFPAPEAVVSVSRDHTVRLWKRTSTTPPSYEGTILNQIDAYINSVAYLPPSQEFPDGLVVSGGKDPCLDVRKPTSTSSDNADRILPGHANNVSALAAAPSGKYFVSGSWDQTARVWSTESWESEVTLAGHEAAVWDVLPLSDNAVATACADKKIRIFDLRKAADGSAEARSTIQTPDIVRGLCRLPAGHPTGAELASGHNDGIIRLWKLSGQPVGELHGHESFVYRLKALPSGEIVSAGEDRTVRVWKGTDCIQTITHPAISVWTVAVNPQTGDIVSGTSDGVVRIFTRAADRVASAETIQLFEEAIKSSSIPQQQMGDINKEKLPGPEFLTQKSGTKEGQVQMIREANGSITAHTWSMGAQTWVNVGTVVDSAASSGRKQGHEGKEYDYVFDVAIEEGAPSLKLPFNLSDNPYDAATKFINDNELSPNYLDQVAQFIIQNTQGATLGESSAGGPDPWGTESRYRPGEAESSARPKILPLTEYLTITAAKYEPIFKKILSVNSALVAAGRKDISLNPSAQALLNSIRQSLESNKPVDDEDALDILVKICTAWDYSDRLAPLDILRCAAASPLLASSPRVGNPIHIVITASTKGVPAGGNPNENTVMMAFRTIANLFLTAEGRNLLSKPEEAARSIDFVRQALGLAGGEAIGKYNRNLLIALSTVAINYAVLASKGTGLPKDVLGRLLEATEHLLSTQKDSEVLFRSIAATGTLAAVLGKDAAQSAIQPVTRAKDAAIEPRVKEAADECLALLR